MNDTAIILLDNTVLSNFASIQRPDLVLLALGNSAATVEEVLDELEVGVNSKAIPQVNWSWLATVAMTENERAVYQDLLRKINKGEAACLAVAAGRGGRVMTDDRDARKIAVELQIPISGTIGILIRLVDLGRLTILDADEFLSEMIERGYFSPIRSLTEIL